MKALLIEADASRLSQLRAALQHRGWRVTTAETAAAGLRAFETSPFPLVLVGRTLPDMDGLDLVRSLRRSTTGRASYVLVTLAAAVPEATRPLVEAGVDDFVTTPLLPTQLAMRLAFAECRLAVHPGDPVGEAEQSYPERIAELEQAMRVQNAALEELIQSAPEGIVVVDEQDRGVRVNSEFTRMFGYQQDEVLGVPINQLIVPDHLQEEGLRITRGVVGGERLMLETVRMHRDGRLIDVSVLATPIRVGDGAIGAYGIYRDITERKAQERALRESEARYRALFDQSPVGVFLCDPELRITHCNRRLTQIVGAPHEAILGTRLSESSARAILPGLDGLAVDRPAFYAGPHHDATDERVLSLTIRYAPLRDPDGQLIGGMGVVEDVTERQEAEQRLRAQAAELERVNSALRERTLELEEAMQARSRLYTAMNHELRTPISAIMLYQELLLTGALGDLPEAQATALQHSHTAAQHLLELVQDVLDLSKIEAGKLSLQLAQVSPRALLHDLLPTVEPLARRYGSELRLEIPSEPPCLRTDPQRVRQILLNLVSNAARFGRGHPIVVRCRTEPAGALVIEVEDRGVGIDAADLPRIFEDFVQVGKVREGGTGLGLAISRRLADLLHGRLEVESEPEHGSTFRLVLPTTAFADAPDGPVPTVR